MAYDVLVKEFKDFTRLRQFSGFALNNFTELFVNDFVAQVNALIADVNAWASDQFLDLLLALSAERTLEQIGCLSNARHVGRPFLGKLFRERRNYPEIGSDQPFDLGVPREEGVQPPSGRA
ncbi:unannotated protein [freshwater metagenome]|uniref:Unannotated protein n=1 Tax=freshwater metagenome TaxID=449393 RepID=A0A6J6HZV8_9ZZZZ